MVEHLATHFGVTRSYVMRELKVPTHPEKLRDKFAAEAMQALATQQLCWRYSRNDADTAARCYEMADAMLEARNA